MIFIGKITKTRQPKTIDSLKVAYMYAIMLIICVVCQLFTFEKFVPLIESFGLPWGELGAKIIAFIIVTCEVFSLPFLLRIDVWQVFRVKSMILSWIVPLIWLFLAIWINLSPINISTVGFLGTVVNLVPGWWAVFFSISLGILSFWASWGLWPIKPIKK